MTATTRHEGLNTGCKAVCDVERDVADRGDLLHQVTIFGDPCKHSRANSTPTSRQMPSPCRACGCWGSGVFLRRFERAIVARLRVRSAGRGFFAGNKRLCPNTVLHAAFVGWISGARGWLLGSSTQFERRVRGYAGALSVMPRAHAYWSRN